MNEKTCANHPTEKALATCGSCGRGLCGECWCRNVDALPWCELCLHHLTSVGRGQAITVTFALLCSTASTIVWRWEQRHPHRLVNHFWLGYCAFGLVGIAYLTFRRPPEIKSVIRARSSVEQAPFQPSGRVGRPYRSALQRSVMFVASPVSGLWTTTILLLCMAASAVAISGILKLPFWVEAEWVIVAWWIMWSLTLSTLLYRGWRLSDDHILAPPRTPWSQSGGAKPRLADGCNSGCDFIGCSDAGGLGEVLVALLVFVLLVIAAWFFVELLLPTLFSYAYYLVRTSLARVANDRHGCEAKFGAAIGWGTFWASLYAIPFAVVVLVIHIIMR